MESTRHNRGEYLGYCEVCDRPIYEEDARYEMPDGILLCDDSECLEDWAQQYHRLGGVVR